VSPVRHYHTQRGEGKLFSIDLLDKQGGEIRAVMFNNAVDKFSEIFKPKHCYLISGGTVKVGKKVWISLFLYKFVLSDWLI
jgi:replication factor A1